jgi:outer membrane immunogenic protein
MKKSLIGIAAIAAMIGPPALAADMPVKLTPPPLILDWAGFYVGAHAGGGWSNETTDPFQFFTDNGPANNCAFAFVPPCPALTSVHGSGALYGAQFGYNWQPYARWITGVEADISGASTRGTSFVSWMPTNPISLFTNTLESKVRDVGTVRGKVGFLAWDNILIYGTGGLAFGQVRNTLTSTSNIVGGGNGPSSFSPTNTSTQFGWSTGAGADWKIGNLILGVLYLHYDLGVANQTLTANGGIAATGGGTPTTVPVSSALPNAHVTVDAVSARASWLFR